MRDTAVFFLAHQWTESIAFRFARLWREVSPHADCRLLLHDDGGVVTQRWLVLLKSMGAADALCLFRPESVSAELGVAFFGDRGVMSNAHLPMFNAAHGGSWRWCWQIESDVEYRGDWWNFLQPFDRSNADLLASHIHRHQDWPTWRWWDSLNAPAGVERGAMQRLKAFLPVFRISRGAIDALLQAQRQGWEGHFEALVPTVLAMREMQVEDLRSAAPCYVGESQNPQPVSSLQSTMRWRPQIGLNEFAGRSEGPLLFHPVKQNWAFDSGGVRRWPEPQRRAPA